MIFFKSNLFIFSLMIIICCNQSPRQATTTATDSSKVITEAMLPSKDAFRQTIDGKATDLYVLKNKNNMQAAFTNYGGRLVSLLVPARDNKLVDISIGFDSVQQYKTSSEPYFGATIGRCGNRIAKGKFTLNKQQYVLALNNGPNTLHGGKKSF